MNPLREAAALLRQCDRPELIARVLETCSDRELHDLMSTWQLLARPKQLRPRDCRQIWILKSGRGSGKTRSAAEDCLDTCEDWGDKLNGALVSKSIGDVRDTMIEGVSGLQACARRRGYNVDYIANRGLVVHPSGSRLHVMSAESAEFGRGPNLNYFWADEVGAWPTNALARFQAFLFAWRLRSPASDGKPRGTITMTPKPNAITRWVLRSDVMSALSTVMTESTSANLANIDASALYGLFHGTRLGRQELDGELLDDEGAVFLQDDIHRWRVSSHPDLDRVIVSIDPGFSDREGSDETGILVVGEQGREHAYVLADYTFGPAKFSQWAHRAVVAYVVHNADCIIAEINGANSAILEAIETAARIVGEDLGTHLVVPVRSVWASESKRARAEPIGAYYERGYVHHVGHFEKLEREQTTWVPGAPSPNRMDALVHGITHLLLGDRPAGWGIGMYDD